MNFTIFQMTNRKQIRNGLFFMFTFFVYSFSNAQCTASNALQFNDCLDTSTSLYVDQSYTVPDNVNISGISIDIKNNRNLVFSGTITVNSNTFFSGNGNAKVSNSGVTASSSPGQGDITFNELNSRLKSGQYSTLSAAMSGNILPVLFDDFFGEWSVQKIYLEWSTLMEMNNDVFELEHSLDGKEYTVIGTVSGSGTTSEFQTYQFVQDKGFIEGINYYRLKQIDFDGKFEYSPVIVVKVPLTNDISIRPTLVLDQLNIELAHAVGSKARLQLVSSTGQLVIELPMERETKRLSMYVGALEKGWYYVRVIDGDVFSTAEFLKVY